MFTRSMRLLCRLEPARLCSLPIKVCCSCTTCSWCSRRSLGTLALQGWRTGRISLTTRSTGPTRREEEHMCTGDNEATIATSSRRGLWQAPLQSRTSRRRMLQVTLGAAGALCAGSLIAYVERAPVARAEDGEGHALTVVVRWNAATLAALAAAHAGPTVGARALAIVHTCMYDAWAAYQPKALGTRLRAALRAHTH